MPCECINWARTDIRTGVVFSEHHPNCPNRKIKVFTVTPGLGLNSCTERESKMILEWLDNAEPGETITIEVKEMTQREYSELPEYMGP